MGEVTGFSKWGRELPSRRDVPVRLRDWKEVYNDFAIDKVQTQAGRCMDYGIPSATTAAHLATSFLTGTTWCTAAPRDAIDRLHATNNFPEFTGRLCPAPCEAACVLGINADPVTIKQVEVEIIDRAWDEGWVEPQLPECQDRQTDVGSVPVRPVLPPLAVDARRPRHGCFRARR